MSAPINHPTFCFDDSLIENVRFKVHKYQLMKSETFADMFDIAKEGRTEMKPAEGSSLENPIKMEGVSASDFECLLTILYANPFSTQKVEPTASLIIPAFRLANMWNFSDLRISLLPLAEKELDDVDKIVFAREFDINAWLAPAHVNLCQRPAHLSIDEAKKLGINSVLMISIIREEFPPLEPSPNQSQSCSGTSTYCGSYDQAFDPFGAGPFGHPARARARARQAQVQTQAGHCACCSESTDTTHAVVSQTILEKIHKWIENKCICT